ncbi:MAG: transglycosylase SLT domain-containing protein [Bacteroidales bacterium]|nr:transglycosylase SLT domain-containing protein [Bacteroidales bacterium]
MRSPRFFGITLLSIATCVLMVLVVRHPRIKTTPIPPKREVQYTENKTNTLNILLFCHASDYFLYRGTTVGFQYELLNLMCDSLQKEVKFTFTSDPEEVKRHFFKSDFDIIAYDVEPGQADMDMLCFSVPHSTSHAVMMQSSKAEKDGIYSAYLPYYFPATINLDSFPEPPVGWEIVRSDSLTSEELVELLHDDSIHYLITDAYTAYMLNPFYSDVSIVKTVGPEYDRCWVLNPANIAKNDSINNWLTTFKQSKEYAKLCDKYFHPRSRYVLNGGREKRRGSISSYDALMKQYGKKLDIDWRFVSSIIRQESGFRTDLVGVGGSFGVMQMMPATARNFGIDSTSSAAEQIYAGMRLIARLDKMFVKYVPDPNERLYYVAAAYNAGSGHIVDACELCLKHGGDVTSWNDVSKYLLLKMEHQYYSDPVVKCGYYPGRHTVRYVEAVMKRYHGYTMSLPKK